MHNLWRDEIKFKKLVSNICFCIIGTVTLKMQLLMLLHKVLDFFLEQYPVPLNLII